MSDTNKLVAAILAAGRCAGNGDPRDADFMRAYKAFLDDLNTSDQAATAAAHQATTAAFDEHYEKIGRELPDA